MANVPMADAVFGALATSAEYNNVTANVRDLNTRLTTVETGPVIGRVRLVHPTQTTPLQTAPGVATAADIPKLQMLSVPVVSGNVYRFDYRLNLGWSVANDVHLVQLRRTTAVSGTLLGHAQFVSSVTGVSAVFASITWVANVTGNQSFFVNTLRAAGSGNVYVYQDADHRNYAEMTFLGVSGDGVVTTPA